MHAYLVTPSDQEKINSLIKDFNSSRMDFVLKSISECKELQRFASLSISSPTTVVIEDFHLASMEAQNAFLKSLEEPQESLQYILTAPNEGSVISTISSRCQLIKGAQQNRDNQEISEFLDQSLGEKLRTISSIKARDEATKFVTEIINTTHRKMILNPLYAKKSGIVLETLKNLQANGNIGLHLTKMVLDLNLDYRS